MFQVFQVFQQVNDNSKHRETLKILLYAFVVSRCLESPFINEVRVFEIASQSIRIDILIALFTEQLNASKEIVHHTELIFGVQTTLAGYVIEHNFIF